MKDWFTVGEIASLFNLNVQTLHYYESIGLFCPVRKRESTGLRIYQFDQIYALATIRFLKKLEYPLKRIRETMDSRDPDFSLNMMRAQSQDLRVKCAELERIRQAIDRKIRFVEEHSARIDIDSVERRTFPLRKYIPIGLEEAIYGNDDFYFYPTVVFYRGPNKSFGAMLTEDLPGESGGAGGGDSCGESDDEGGKHRPALKADAETPQPRIIPAGDYMVGYHRGPYECIPESFARIRDAARSRSLSLADETVNINIIDQFVERDPCKYVTEVQIRILD